ncbi:hypothetical protein JW964_20680 [candidate division KSB1 bacterium]|nr:hypothetical protein [candidate division KSB1 bacterium]
MRLSENTKTCHCEVLFTEACFSDSQSPQLDGTRLLRHKKTLLAMTVPAAFADKH